MCSNRQSPQGRTTLQSAINGLGLRAPRFPSLGSASPSAAHIVLSDCTRTGGPSAPGGRTLPKP